MEHGHSQLATACSLSDHAAATGLCGLLPAPTQAASLLPGSVPVKTMGMQPQAALDGETMQQQQIAGGSQVLPLQPCRARKHAQLLNISQEVMSNVKFSCAVLSPIPSVSLSPSAHQRSFPTP